MNKLKKLKEKKMTNYLIANPNPILINQFNLQRFEFIKKKQITNFQSALIMANIVSNNPESFEDKCHILDNSKNDQIIFSNGIAGNDIVVFDIIKKGEKNDTK